MADQRKVGSRASRCECASKFPKPRICPEHGFIPGPPIKNPVKPRGQR